MREAAMPYLVPPMDPDPPGDFVVFVADNLALLQSRASRLVGGAENAHEVYPEALADVAGRWRRLRLLHRLGRPDATADYLERRLAARAKQWREDQIYEVEVRALRPEIPLRTAVPDSVARRLAPLLPPTVRAHRRPLAEAAISWGHAYHRAQVRRLLRGAAVAVLVFVALLQSLPHLPGR
jgi:hypothetical protein